MSVYDINGSILASHTTVDVTPTEGGEKVTITDSNGVHQFDTVNELDPDSFALEQDEETGLVYIVIDGQRSANGIPLAGGGGGGGGGGGNNAVLTVTNTTGWLSKTLSEGASCELSLNWSSIEDGMATGGGTMTVSVGGVTKLSQNVNQGNLTVNVTDYLATGSNKVKVKVTDVYDNSKVLSFTINVVALRVTSYFSTSSAFEAGAVIPFTYTPVGAVEKTMHFVVDGTEVGTAVVTTSGAQQTYNLPAMAHGAHTLLVYFTAVIDGETVSSNELFYDMIVADSSSSVPIIASPFRSSAASQYETLQIPYTVYTPGSLSSQVALYANGTQVASLTVDRTEQTWSYRADTTGVLTLTIVTGTVVKSFTLTVAQSAIDVEPVTDSLVLHLSSYGRSNYEADPSVWEDDDNDISCTLSDFNYVSDGWVLDSDGNTVLRVAGDARVTIPYQPFAQDFRGTGKTIELEFATRTILDYDAVIMSCMSGGRGFQLTAQMARLASEQSEISTQYKEDEHVRISFVAEKRTENRLLYIYINGIMSGVVQYPAADDFSQTNPVDITIGSNYVTTDIYNIRIYDNDLTRQQILGNWIADTQNITTMLARYDHNNVYDEYGSVTIENLPGDLPYLVLSAPELPQTKGDKKTVSGYYVDPVNTSKSFSFTGAEADVQGTSSQYYARKNYKIKFKNGFTMTSSGETVSTFAMRSDSIPTKTFTFKADVASSEGANNVELVRLYCNACPYETPPQEEDSRVRQGIDGFPIVIFWDNGSTTQFVGKYNFNNDKGTEEVFGFASGDESWETLQNSGQHALWKSADYSGTAWQSDFEGRYPDGSTDTTNLAALAAWLVTTDQTTATGNALPSTYTDSDGGTHTTDNAAYRVAKFRTEAADHFEMDSLLFYYIFTELFLMVDSRVKNSFPTRFNADGKWCFLPYDMDTAIGIDNQGALTYGYSLEDTDYIGTEGVFNGQSSVLWNNVREAFPAEIKSMYQTLRSQGKLSYAVVEQMFETHQAKWPEAIFNEDAWYKYIDPLVNEGNGNYLSMALGSKAEQRKWWLYNRFHYIDSKYVAGDAAAEVITLRPGAIDTGISVTPYADIYATIAWDATIAQIRTERGHTSTLACPYQVVGNNVISIYNASQIASVGDLSGFKCRRADFHAATKLQSIKVGDAAEGYTNPNLLELIVGSNDLLASVDARNCTALTGTIDLSGASNIEDVYFDGTAISAVSLPNGGILKTLRLPGTITNLTVQNQPGIETFYMPDYSSITTLRIENCGDAIPVLDILDDMAAGSRVRVIGVNFTFSVAEVTAFFDRLDAMKGLDENGDNLENAVISGTITITETVSTSWYNFFTSKYPLITIVATTVNVLKSYIQRTLTSYSSPTIQTVRQYAFASENARTGYTVPRVLASVDLGRATSIQDNAFRKCTALKTLYLGSETVVSLAAVTVFTDTPFASGKAGGTIYIPSSLYAHLGDGSEYDYQSATNWSTIHGYGTITWAEIPADHVTENFYDSILDSIVDGSITELTYTEAGIIGIYAFYNCRALVSVDAPYVTDVHPYAFDYCTALSTLNMPRVSQITHGGYNTSNYAFAHLTSLDEIYLPRLSITSANADYVFGFGKSGSSIILPKISDISSMSLRSTNAAVVDLGPVQSLTEYNFYHTWQIKTVILRRSDAITTATSTSSITRITSSTKVYVPAALIDSYKAATNWSDKGDIFYPIEGSEYEHYYANGVGVFQDVTRTLTNVTSSHSADDDIVSYGDPYGTTLTADEGMSITSVTITHNGTDITSTAYDSATGIVSIPEVTGPITITATAE